VDATCGLFQEDWRINRSPTAIIFVATRRKIANGRIEKMRQNVKRQYPLAPAFAEEQHSKELKAISDILDEHPEIAELAQQDLTHGRQSKKGRKGMSGEQAIRVMLVKQIHGLSYRELRFHLGDSAAFLAFSRLPFGTPIKLQTLQSNVKRLRAPTLEALNRALLKDAEAAKIELGRKTRTDCTVVKSNIHEPSDSSLLWDCVRVVTRIINRAIEAFPHEDWSFFHDRARRAKKRAFEIKFPPKKGDKTKQRQAAYRDLLAATQETYAYGLIAEAKIRLLKPASIQEALMLEAWADKLRGHLDSTTQVIDQTRRRVIEEEKGAGAGETGLDLREAHGHHHQGSTRHVLRSQDLPDWWCLVVDPRLRDRGRQSLGFNAGEEEHRTPEGDLRARPAAGEF
jgi:IS5 family transposase